MNSVQPWTEVTRFPLSVGDAAGVTTAPTRVTAVAAGVPPLQLLLAFPVVMLTLPTDPLDPEKSARLGNRSQRESPRNCSVGLPPVRER